MASYCPECGELRRLARRPMRRAFTFGLVALVAGVASAWVLPPAAVSQPLAFNHARHAAVTCAGCHGGVETRQRASLPGADVCAKCHATAPASVAGPAWERLMSGDAPFWNRLTAVPDHVMFSHRRHVAIARLACESCHADIGRRTTPPRRAPVRLDMDTCLGCHRVEGASEDCTGCHR